MAQFDAKTLAIVKRLQNARLSLLLKHPFYALLLMYMKFSIDLTCETAYTDGNRIAFNPEFMQDLSDSELEFVLMHEVLHTALGHPFRHQQDYDQVAFDIACDIVVNSNILYSCGMDRRKITLQKYGESMHIAPDGKEGYLYTVEQVYELVCKALNKPLKKQAAQSNNNKQGGSGNEGQGNGNGNGSGDGDGGGDGDGNGNGNGNGNGKGKGSGKGKGRGSGQGGDGSGSGNPEDPSQADLQALIQSLLQRSVGDSGATESLQKQTTMEQPGTMESCQNKPLDDHSFWEGDDEIAGQQDVWLQRMVNATDIISSMGGKDRGTMPLAAERIIDALKNPILDWRTILNDFVQEEICDYSFAPPDRRMEDSPFFLPDFNEKDEKAKDILFMIDTSRSMSDDQITQCYSEIYGAIGQFNGKLQGKLGFFDATVVEPTPFEDEDEFKIIRPKGGGGTSFHIIFEYVEKFMQDELPVSIVILTDGFAPWPAEADALGIPVLWIINNEEAQPPWGKVARLLDK